MSGLLVFLALAACTARWSAPQRIAAGASEASHPRIVPAARGFFVAWTSAGKPGERILGTESVNMARH